MIFLKQLLEGLNIGSAMLRYFCYINRMNQKRTFQSQSNVVDNRPLHVQKQWLKSTIVQFATIINACILTPSLTLLLGNFMV